MPRFHFTTVCAIPFVLAAAALPASAQSQTDACTWLTQAQVGAAAGAAVGKGEHVTPTFVKTCTWNASDGSASVRSVTMHVQTAASYDGGKRMATQMVAGSGGAAVKAASVGDDAYYFVAGDQVGLLVKKGSDAFKVAVYAKLPVEKKEAMELALAREAVAKL